MQEGTKVVPPADVAERWLKDPKKQKRPARFKRRNRTPSGGGGRWLVWVGRAVLWGLVAVLLVNGIYRLATTPDAPRTAAPDPAVPQGTGGAFPTQAAEAFAVRFASVYLEWDAVNPQARADTLAGYVPEGAEEQFGWAGNGRQVAVLVLPVHTEVRSPSSAVVTVAAEVTGPTAPRWVHLAVPVYTDGAGRFLVTDLPALVPGPGEAAAPNEPLRTSDSEVADQLREPLTAFFRAYAGTEPGELAYLLAPGVQVGTLGGIVTFEGMQLQVPRGGDRRDVVADVRWADPVTGSTFTQSYELTVARSDDGRWYIERLGAHPAASSSAPEENP